MDFKFVSCMLCTARRLPSDKSTVVRVSKYDILSPLSVQQHCCCFDILFVCLFLLHVLLFCCLFSFNSMSCLDKSSFGSFPQRYIACVCVSTVDCMCLLHFASGLAHITANCLFWLPPFLKPNAQNLFTHISENQGLRSVEAARRTCV